MFFEAKLIIFIITVSVYGTDLKKSFKFEEDGHSNGYINTELEFESERNSQSDYDLNNNDPTFEDNHEKVQFNQYYSGNINYQDINVETKNKNKQIVFKDDTNIKTVKNTVKFESNDDEETSGTSDVSEVSGRIAFEEMNTEQKPDKKKRRKRRRKPKYQSYPGPINPNLINPTEDPGYGNLGTENAQAGPVFPNIGYPSNSNPYPAYPQYPSSVYPGQNPALAYLQPGVQYPGYPAQLEYPNGNLGHLPGPQNQGYGLYTGLQQPGVQGYRPRRPKSLASKALSALSEALTSIATNDDQQCVPRLLCEAAGDRVPGSTSLLQSVAGLDPLLSMLSAYNGVSASPLFVFGRAVILGVTSKGNAASCRYAYPQCPTDPDKLIHYLNNHNGGFFRFFNSPVPQQNQNVEQFYNQLAGQYGLYQPDGNQQNLGHHNQYGLVNQNLHHSAHNYGYGQNKYGLQQYRKDKIEDRIQNKPVFETNDDEVQNVPINYSYEDDFVGNNQKWLFPDDNSSVNDIRYENKPSSVSKTVKFPEENKYDAGIYKDYVRKGKQVFFPQHNTRLIRNYDTTTAATVDDYVFDYKHNFYVKKPKVAAHTVRDDGVATVYIVRGNGDPNHPEIVKVQRGQYA